MSARDERVTLAIRETVDQHFILTDLRGKPLYCKCRNWSVEDPDAPYPAHRAHLATRLRLAVLAALADDPAQATLARAWDDGYNDAATMAHCYGHTDHWEDEPTNPYRAALAGGATEGSEQ